MRLQAEDFGDLSVKRFPNQLLPRRPPQAGGIKAMVCHDRMRVCVIQCLVQMHFKYAFTGDHGKEQFEVGVVLARQFLTKGPWLVWDLRPDAEKWCNPCSSAAERIVRHDGRCPIPLKLKALRGERVAAARQAIADRSRREREERDRVATSPEAQDESGGKTRVTWLRSAAGQPPAVVQSGVLKDELRLQLEDLETAPDECLLQPRAGNEMNQGWTKTRQPQRNVLPQEKLAVAPDECLLQPGAGNEAEQRWTNKRQPQRKSLPTCLPTRPLQP